MNAKPWGTEWSDALSMSNAEIDAEHQHFGALISRLNDEIDLLEQGRRNMLETMQQMLDYAASHFTNEERLLGENAYPAREEHADIHRGLIGELRQAMQTMQETDDVGRWAEVAQAVDRLMREHLENEDSKYIDFLRDG